MNVREESVAQAAPAAVLGEYLRDIGPGGIVIFEPAPPFRVLAHNRVYQEMWSEPMRSSGLVGLALGEFATQAEESGVLDIFREVVATRRARAIPRFRYRGMPGGERWFDWSLAPVVRRGELVALANMAVDITAEVQARKVAEAERRRLVAVLETLPVGVAIADADGRVTEYNAALSRLWGRPPRPEGIEQYAAFRGWWADDGTPLGPEDWAMARALRTGKLVPGDIVEIQPFDRGARVTVLNAAAPIVGADGATVGGVVATVDISAQRSAEARLRDAEARLRALSEATSDALILTEHGVALEVNGVYTAMLGFSPEEVIGKNGFDVATTPESRAAIMQHVLAGNEQPYETVLRRKDGTDVAVEIQGKNVLYKGRWVRVASVRDISARKRAEAERRESEERFRTLADNMSQLAWMADASGYIFWYNRRWFDYTGTTLDEIKGWGWTKLHHPEHADRVVARIQRSWDTGEVWEDVFPLRARDGGYRWFLSRAVPVRDAAGKVSHWFGTNTDITEIKLAEERIRQSEQRFQMAVRATNDAIWDWCIEDGSLWWNEGLHALFGHSAAEVEADIGWWHRQVHPEDRERVVAGIHAVMEGEASFWREEYRFRRADGSYASVFDRGYVMRDASGKAERMLGAMQDQTARKQAEEALKEADRRKDEFLATLAHELRNPLAPIRNAVQLMRLRGTADPTLQSARDMVDRQVTHMVRLIDDLLDVSRITRGKLELRKDRVTLAAVIEQALETARPHIGHELVVSLPHEPVFLDADAVRLAQLFSNLLNNAAKYTGKGGSIRISAAREGPEVVVKVSDTGIGIAAEHLPNVFEMFSQATPALERAGGGLGIGLAVVRGLAELHGGTVSAHSEGLGKGSEFTVRLPLAERQPAQATPQAPAAAPRAREGRRILVVEDNQDAAHSLAMLLRLDGSEVDLAHDGVAGLEKARELRPDVVLLDIGLPRMNGYEVCRSIRGEPWGSAVPIIALTGWGQEEDRRKSREAGFDRHLVKPVDYGALIELLQAL